MFLISSDPCTSALDTRVHVTISRYEPKKRIQFWSERVPTGRELQGLLEIKDTHRRRTLRKFYAQEHRTFLGAVRALTFELPLYDCR